MRRSRLLPIAATLLTSSLLVACSSSPAPSATDEAGQPTSVQHALGTTELPANPERVATVAWSNEEVPLALGVMPVGFAAATWGVEDDSKMLPWTKERVEELGGDPVLFDETDGINFEQVAATEPDLILGAYSGLTADEYNTLTEIAPTIAYSKGPWLTTWRDIITENSAALGMGSEGEELVDELESTIADSTAKYPQLKGKTAAFMKLDPSNLSKVNLYTTADPRAAYLVDLGLETPASVTESSDSDDFYFEVSAEQIDQVADVDILVIYGDEELLETLQDHPLLSKHPAIANGSVVLLGSDGPLAASANPSPLSIPWGIDKYHELLAEAADKVK